MPNIKIAMPIKTGQAISKLVLSCLYSQTTTGDLVVNSEDEIISATREISINFNRHKIQSIIRRLPCEYVLLLDSDVLMLSNNIVERFIEELEKDSELNAISVETQKNSLHTMASCAMMRWQNYDSINFLYNPEKCQCLKIAELGKIKYLESANACELRDYLI